MCKWYQTHLGADKVVLITNDRDNAKKGKNEGIDSYTIEEYATKHFSKDHPELLDILSNSGNGGSGSGKGSERKKILFDEFLPSSEVLAGIKRKDYFKGVIHMKRFNCLEASVFSKDYGQEILIQGRENINRVVDGDVVAVKILPKEKWGKESTLIMDNDEQEQVAETIMDDNNNNNNNNRNDNNNNQINNKIENVIEVPTSRPCGRVVGVIKRSWKPLCGSVDAPRGIAGASMSGETTLLFRPLDARMPKVRIRSRQGNALVGQRIVVAMEAWERTSMYPTGHFVRALGAVGDPTSESESILIQYDVPYRPFSEAVLKCLPELPWKFDASRDMVGREDHRDCLVCSIDPEGCKDIDDALHLRFLPNGNLEVGVHIADVSHFVREGTPLDDEAQRRSTTVYLEDRRIDMLPKPLTEDICSLKCGDDRLAFSVIWELTPAAEEVSVHFCKSVIHPRFNFSYKEAQAIIDDAGDTSDVARGLRALMSLSDHLHAKRLAAGALVLGSAEVKFTKDDNYQPVDLELYTLYATNRMVEEWMLAANVAVAAKTREHFNNCAILRRHPDPDPARFDGLQSVLAARGLPPLDLRNSQTLAQTLDAAQDPSDPVINQLVRMLATRCMMQARYFSSGSVASPEEFHHYGLAMDIYTHFTSPIRRYADVLVHRLLASAIGVIPVSKYYNNEAMSSICDNMNMRHTMAQYAGRASSELYTTIHFKGKPTVKLGYVTSLRRNGFLAYIPDCAVESVVYVCDADDTDAFTLDLDAQTLVSKDKKTVIKVFDKVKVLILVDDDNNHQLTLNLLSLDPPISKIPEAVQETVAEQLRDFSKTATPNDEKKKESPAPAAEQKRKRSDSTGKITTPAKKKLKSK